MATQRRVIALKMLEGVPYRSSCRFRAVEEAGAGSWFSGDGPRARQRKAVAQVLDLMDLAVRAPNGNAARGGGVVVLWVLVAGVGFEPTTFRL